MRSCLSFSARSRSGVLQQAVGLGDRAVFGPEEVDLGEDLVVLTDQDTHLGRRQTLLGEHHPGDGLERTPCAGIREVENGSGPLDPRPPPAVPNDAAKSLLGGPAKEESRVRDHDSLAERQRARLAAAASSSRTFASSP
jgi:hypothetical protein